MGKVIKNDQILDIKEQDLEKPKKTDKYDSTIDERERTYQGRKAEPRFTEYR